jgi:hypothetical protein
MVDNNNHLKFIAIFLITLTILVPIQFSVLVNAYTPSWGPGASHSTASSGQFVAIKSINGIDGISHFRRRQDSVTIIAQVSLGNNVTVSPDNLVAYFSGYALGTFQQCSLVDPSTSIYECTFTERNDTGPATPSVQTYEVRLINGTQILTTTSSVITVDAIAPSIIYLNPSTTLTANENITISFQVKDYAFGSTNGVGIKSVELTANGETQYVFPEGNSSDVYDPISSIDILTRTVPVVLGSSSGTYPICLNVEDYFNQRNSQCINVIVDKNAPLILTESLEILDESGNPAKWLNDQEKALSVYMEFKADDIDINSIYGNFSDAHLLGHNSDVKPFCNSLQDNTYGCTFTTTARINQSKSYTFSFYAKDVLGNLANSHTTYQLNFDNTGPSASALLTPKYYNGNYFIGNHPINITINFVEQGIGMNDSQAFLDLSSVGLGIIQAYNCSPSWSCVWPDISVSESAVSSLDNIELTETINDTQITHEIDAKQAQVHILSTTQDDLGNPSTRNTFNLSVDVYDPIINGYNITPISGDALYEGVTVVGDSMHILFNITDASFITMNITADDFFSQQGGFSDSYICNDNLDGTHTCEYILGPISREGYYEGELKLLFYDFLGNSVLHTEKIEVLEILNETPNYWSVSDSGCSPNPLDRELVNRMPSDIYCRPRLSSNSNAEIYHVTGIPCTGKTAGQYVSNDGNTTNIISSSNWMGLARNDPGSLYINFVTNTFNPRVDKLEVTCGLNIRSIVDGKRITALYESKNVTFNVNLYNNPLGEVDQVVWKKVDSIYNEYVKDGWGLIGDLNAFFEFSGKMCGLANKILQIVTGLSNIGLLLGMTSATLDKTPITSAAGSIIEQVSKTSTSASDGLYTTLKNLYSRYLGPYCDFVSCKIVIKGGDNPVSRALLKYISFMQTANMVNNIQNIGEGWWDHTKKSYDKDTTYYSYLGDSTHENRKSAENVANKADTKHNDRNWYTDGIQQNFVVSGQTIKNNYILSAATLCVPGLIYNANKYREIQCLYGSCLISSAQTGMQSSLCDDNKDYAECKFFFGPIFDFIPFVGFLEDITKIVANIFADPWVLIDMTYEFVCNTQLGAKLICPKNCENPTFMLWICVLYDTVKLYTSIASDLEAMSDGDYWSYEDTGVCSAFEESYKELKNIDIDDVV